MSVLDRYFALLTEGEGDQAARQDARDVYQRALEALRKVKPSGLELPKPGKLIASLNLGELLKEPELDDLDLAFEKSSSESVRGQMGVVGDRARIVIQVALQGKGPAAELTPEQWRQVVAKTAPSLLERAREIFFHEFTHYRDWKRMGKKTSVLGKTPKMSTHGKQAYYSSPLEFNAFLQQGLGNIEHYLAGKPPAEVEKTVGPSADEFYRRVLKVLTPGFAQNLTPAYQAKLKKRVAKAYEDIKAKMTQEKG